MSSRPLIGVTGPDRGGLAAWYATWLALRRAGGRAVRITPRRPRAELKLDGLIIGGGADVDPVLYGAHRHTLLEDYEAAEPRLGQRLLGLLVYPLLWALRRTLLTHAPEGDADRDRLEQALIRDALDRDLPLLGICRGMQLMNVVCGGSLHQGLEGFHEEHPQIRSVLPRKTVALAPDSVLRQILGCERCPVNALHDQGVDRLGEGLRVVAREPNGVIQAVEHTRRRFAIGVQWHPEYLPQKRSQQGLFRALVDAAHQKCEA
ncbi:gamma-glutamyl-gamma-aminobutyrate hydrolase family protein [Thioalkalivibrio sulfidiphilus]|uniref:gamma-glutamyl-gamma-aminobutyrate hydrolase family protein n=1 Tax=Thioalkalivibrio sulfidiphilus TaxID=1033854 RepID=UPI003BAEFF04